MDAVMEDRVYQSFRHFWHPVAYSHECTGAPRRATLLGHQLVVVRLDDEICAFDDLCAHRGTALSLGAVVDKGRELRCAYHGWQYDKHGHCTLTPQRPELSRQLRARVRKHQALERHGLIWVCLERTSRSLIPEYPTYEDPRHQPPVFLAPELWACSAPRRVENYCDLAHFAFVHDGTLGDINRPEVPRHRVWRDGPCLRMDFEMVEPAGSGKYDSLGLSDDVVQLTKTYVHMPLTVRHELHLPGNRRYILFFHATPVDRRKTQNFTVAMRNYGGPDTNEREIVEFQRVVYGEDQPIVESQRPEELPEDLSEELHLKGVDTFSILYRKWLLELATKLTENGEASSLGGDA
jgi:vanillate O-demethylase monooxygenase subunit